jgi:hypothetical protein
MRRKIAGLAVTSALALSGIAAPALAQQVGLVNVQIGNVTILRNVDVAVAATVVAQVCNIDANAAVLAVQTVDETGQTFRCEQRGSGRTVAVTDA